MKGRESGMPEDSYWETFFNPRCVVEKLDCAESRLGVIEFGCGYGHFTVPAAELAQGPVFALDFEPEMVTATLERVRSAGLTNVVVEGRDFVEKGCGLPDESVDHVMLYNILHLENPVGLLREAYRALVHGGKVSVIHWRSDIETPRGPSLEIRPRPEQCVEWAKQAGLSLVRHESLGCCSYHYGVVFERT
jgi:SAM-dependent methyltransferase